MASEPSSTMTTSVAPSNRTYGSSSIHPLEDRHRAALLVDRAETELMVGDELACYVLIAKYIQDNYLYRGNKRFLGRQVEPAAAGREC